MTAAIKRFVPLALAAALAGCDFQPSSETTHETDFTEAGSLASMRNVAFSPTR